MARRAGVRRKGRIVWLGGLVALACVLFLAALDRTPLDRLTPLVFDLYQRLEPRPEAMAPVAVVDIDEASIAALGQWPWSRSVIARLVDTLGSLGAATIAFDVVFSEPDRTSLAQAAEELAEAGIEIVLPPGQALRDNDALLAEAFARNSVTAGFVISNATTAPLARPKAGFSFAGADPTTYLPAFDGGVPNLPMLTEAAEGMGFFSFPPSADGIVRAIPIVASSQGALYPSLAVEALRVAQGAGSFIVRSTGAGGEVDSGAAAMTALRAGALDIPTGPAGEFWVYFSGLPSMPIVPAVDLLRGGEAEIAQFVA
jgi:adenylate cyclase